jgi:N-formylglutamate amidohydrolase
MSILLAYIAHVRDTDFMQQVRHIRTSDVMEIPETYSVVERDSPFILSAPHGGPYVLEKYANHYTFGDGIRVDNDMYTAEVYPLGLGTSIAQHLCPHQVNCNREWIKGGRLDPVRTNSYLPEDPLYTGEYTNEEREDLKTYYDAYHNELARLIEQARERFGFVQQLLHTAYQATRDGAVQFLNQQ